MILWTLILWTLLTVSFAPGVVHAMVGSRPSPDFIDGARIMLGLFLGSSAFLYWY